MLESVRSTQAAPGYCSRKQPRRKRQILLIMARYCQDDICVCYLITENCFLPVCEVVFVQVQESRGDVTSHPLKNQGLRGHGFCSPAASEVTLHIPLDTEESNKRSECYSLWPLEGSLSISLCLLQPRLNHFFFNRVNLACFMYNWNVLHEQTNPAFFFGTKAVSSTEPSSSFIRLVALNYRLAITDFLPSWLFSVLTDSVVLCPVYWCFYLKK